MSAEGIAQRSVFAMAGYSVFRHADTEVDFYFIVEDNICRLIINVKPELKLIKVLLPIVLPSSPAIANTFVGRSASFCQANVFCFKVEILAFIEDFLFACFAL